MYVNGPTRQAYTEANFDGSNAAPLLIVGPEQRQPLIDRQDRMIENFKALTEEQLSGLVENDVVDFVASAIQNRMHQREGQNGMAYTKRLHEFPRYELVPTHSVEEINEACELSKVGSALLAQQAISATAYGMYHWEGKNLTIVDTARSQLEAPMWDEVSQFTGVDARPTFTAMRRLKVHQFVGGETAQDPIRAMRIEMKRTIAVLPDETHLKARTFAVINTAESADFSQRALRSIYEAAKAGESVSHHPELLSIAERLVDQKLPRGIALARNETVYGYNPKTEEAFKVARAARQSIDDKKFQL